METVKKVTEPQARYINTLLDTRVVPESTADMIRVQLVAGMSSRKASEWIEALKILAWKPKPSATPTVSPYAESDAAIAELDTAFYAIPAGYVSAQSSMIDLHGNDHLFIRVRNEHGGRRMFRVMGSVGGFSYWRVRNPKLALVLAKIIEGREVEFMQNFHKLTGVCGRCSAKLTDLKSRETGFGPDCRKIIGLR